MAETPEPYRPPWWLPGGHAQTIYARLGARRGKVRLQRTTWTTPDDDVLAVDWVEGDAAAPLAILFHGLEGGSESHYAQAMMSAVARTGWRGAVIHFRGCGGLANRTARAYHSGDTPEVDWMLRRMRVLAGEAPLFATGVSLGGNVLLKWLAEQGEAAGQVVHAAASICAPVDLAVGGNALARGFSRIYSRYFLASLQPKALAMLERHPGLFDARAVRRARTLRDFDDAVTAPMFGYRDAEDYWARASAGPHLAGVRVPTLMINALNDPFQPGDALPAVHALSPAITPLFTAAGGHVGYVTGRFPGHVGWLPARIIEFFKAKLA